MFCQHIRNETLFIGLGNSGLPLLARLTLLPCYSLSWLFSTLDISIQFRPTYNRINSSVVTFITVWRQLTTHSKTPLLKKNKKTSFYLGSNTDYFNNSPFKRDLNLMNCDENWGGFEGLEENFIESISKCYRVTLLTDQAVKMSVSLTKWVNCLFPSYWFTCFWHSLKRNSVDKKSRCLETIYNHPKYRLF